MLWETVLELPVPQNPFAGGDPCVDLGDIVAPFASPVSPFTCTVETGTEVFVTAWSSECSTVEAPPYFGSNERELRKCARKADKKYKHLTITVDGTPVPVSEVETRLLSVDLPANNIFGIDPQNALSVGHGWGRAGAAVESWDARDRHPCRRHGRVRLGRRFLYDDRARR